MRHAFLFAGLLLPFASLLGQTHPAAPPASPDPALLEVQSMVDAAKLNDAEATARRYLETHQNSADAHYLLGYILFREGNPKPSLAEYKEGARYRPPGALDLEAIGGDYFLMEDYAAADQWLTKSVQLDPNDVHAKYYLGRAKYNQKYFAEAVRIFTECLNLDPRNAKAADYLGLSYEALGKIEDAFTAYLKAVILSSGSAPENPEPYLNLGTLLVENDRPDEAVPYLLDATRIAPGEWRAHRGLGKAYLQLNRLPESQVELRKAVELAPENAPLHFLLAQVLRKSGLEEQARAETERYNVLTGAHSSPDTPLAEARSLLESGKLPEAEQVTRRYLEIHKSSADGHYLLGYILFKKKDPKSSLAEYTEAARYRKPNAADLQAVAGNYVLLKDYPDADKWFTKAVEWNPKDSLGWYYLGRTKYSENRFAEAVSAFEQCLKLEPRNVKAEDNLGLSFEGLNQIDKAVAAYQTAIDWQKDAADKIPGPSLDLGSLLLDENRANEALPYLLDAARIAPEDFRVHRQLGKAYNHRDQLDKARSELERAVELAPENAALHFMLAQVYRKQGLMDKARTESERYAALAAANPPGEN
ncbi:MAG TPA: tetratricopeptide repeat protein [Bryobacteraceae bacterium]|jgi:tetratricopeptide (TPR) repeat protein|nr:tetratricopeptide repeat protein [Bryobacteraceae bacterium]